MTTEIWKAIPGWESDYEVSDIGRIRSVSRDITHKNGKRIAKKGRVRALSTDQHGYYQCQLKRGGRRKIMKVHRAVAMAFIPNPENKLCVNHKDNNTRNNSVDNLEWCTMKENTHWMMVQGRADRTKQWIERLDASLDFMRCPVIGTEIKTGKTVTYDGVNRTRKDGFSPACVSNCCYGKRKTHKGYMWRFAENGEMGNR